MSLGFPISTGTQYCVREEEKRNRSGETACDQIQQQGRVVRVFIRVQFGAHESRNAHISAPFHLLRELLGVIGKENGYILALKTFHRVRGIHVD